MATIEMAKPAAKTASTQQMVTLRIWRSDTRGGRFEDYVTPAADRSLLPIPNTVVRALTAARDDIAGDEQEQVTLVHDRCREPGLWFGLQPDVPAVLRLVHDLDETDAVRVLRTHNRRSP